MGNRVPRGTSPQPSISSYCVALLMLIQNMKQDSKGALHESTHTHTVQISPPRCPSVMYVHAISYHEGKTRVWHYNSTLTSSVGNWSRLVQDESGLLIKTSGTSLITFNCPNIVLYHDFHRFHFNICQNVCCVHDASPAKYVILLLGQCMFN